MYLANYIEDTIPKSPTPINAGVNQKIVNVYLETGFCLTSATHISPRLTPLAKTTYQPFNDLLWFLDRRHTVTKQVSSAEPAAELIPFSSISPAHVFMFWQIFYKIYVFLICMKFAKQQQRGKIYSESPINA